MALRKSNITPQFVWDDKAGQYRGAANGRFVPRAAVRSAIDNYLANKTLEIRDLGEQLQRREISRASFQKGAERIMSQVHLANAAAAKGGWAQLTKEDYGRVGGLVRSELRYFYKMLRDIEKGRPLDGRFLQRLEQYAQAGRHTFHVIETLEQEAIGNDMERSIRAIADSCDDCIEQEDLGWQFIASKKIKQPGDRTCRRKCKCRKQYGKSSLLFPNGVPEGIEKPKGIETKEKTEPVVPPTPRTAPELLNVGGGMYQKAAHTGSLLDSKIVDQPLKEAAPDQVGDHILPQIAKRQGFDEIPTVVSKAEMKAIKAKLNISYPKEDFPQFPDDYRELPLYRGISQVGSVKQNKTLFDAKKGAEDFKSGPYFVGETGFKGKGLYFTANKETARSLYAVDEKGAVIHAVLKPEAKLARDTTVAAEANRDKMAAQKQLQELQTRRDNKQISKQEFDKESAKLNQVIVLSSDPGRYAAARGYDAMVFNDMRTTEPNVVVFNRTALFVQDDTGVTSFDEE